MSVSLTAGKRAPAAAPVPVGPLEASRRSFRKIIYGSSAPDRICSRGRRYWRAMWPIAAAAGPVARRPPDGLARRRECIGRRTKDPLHNLHERFERRTPAAAGRTQWYVVHRARMYVRSEER